MSVSQKTSYLFDADTSTSPCSGGSLSSTLGLSRICERAGTRSLAVRKRCEFCTQTSPTVYRRGWTCLTPECEKGFWQFNSSTPASVDSCDAFDFEPSFVARRSEAAHLGCEQTDSAGPSTTIPFSIEPTSSVGKIRPSDGLRGRFRCLACKLNLIGKLTLLSLVHRHILRPVPSRIVPRISSIPPMLALRIDEVRRIRIKIGEACREVIASLGANTNV